ncbi:hypothetical protein L873DRAFT_1910301 [Choiromyces venosus 120613-1]|uniref:Uncharacterized protein n=1 Tax=Choiromyces venosus 120613-1 TaxID=1336337 RepID=A0A3N4IRP8_9PEZI|nr:hypothetical protein L873DRAFT_1910301 [Choiromyces venosus 120613-1]
MWYIPSYINLLFIFTSTNNYLPITYTKNSIYSITFLPSTKHSYFTTMSQNLRGRPTKSAEEKKKLRQASDKRRYLERKSKVQDATSTESEGGKVVLQEENNTKRERRKSIRHGPREVEVTGVEGKAMGDIYKVQESKLYLLSSFQWMDHNKKVIDIISLVEG